ncbi:MAG: hypothetical protein AVDCRST_MAG93-5475 [uncultured Chloroflexia bacterium]|uniref:Uncharacterized protein n=1 Tax=uncultured Chloroflexia bacterium TaxID=1672391 RepID=A0A6J4KVN7_9CHLR|nr:MAG: hypothetical protein AVDCRST_MAG93-5475 [uncultured Chloroflexia bacterium]
MSTEERDQRRARLEQLSDLDLTLMAEDYLVSLEDHAAAKDWGSAKMLRPGLDLIDEIMKERGLYDARIEPRRKAAEALLDEVRLAGPRAGNNQKRKNV